MYLVTVLFFFTTISLLLYLYLTRNFNHWKKRNVPFRKPILLSGNFLDVILMRMNMSEFLSNLYTQSVGPYFGFFILDHPYLLVRDVQLVKRVLNLDFKHFNDRTGPNCEKTDPIGTNILLFLKNPKWKVMRSKISPVFFRNGIKLMYQLINDSGASLVQYLKTNHIEIVDFKALSLRYSSDVLSSAIFDICSDCYNAQSSEIMSHVQTIFDANNWWSGFQMRMAIVAPKLSAALGFKLMNAKATTFLSNIFHSVLEQRAEHFVNRQDFINIFLQLRQMDSDFWNYNVLAAQRIMFFVAGLETVSSAFMFIVYEVARNSVVYDKLKKEIDAVYAKDGQFTYNNTGTMRYLENCVKETVRKYPPVPFLDRKCTTDYQLPDSDIVITKGTPIFVSVYGIHHDPLLFPNPEQFNPDRFSNNPACKTNYLGFGAGPRNCIGEKFGMLSVMSGLAHLIRNFDLVVCDETPKNLVFSKSALLLTTAHEVKLKLQLRHHCNNLD